MGLDYDFKCSPATLRNELNDLMSDGYLKQLHHSSGRVPTAKGYRYYVDQSSQLNVPKVQVPQLIHDLLKVHTNTVSLLQDVSHILSRVLNTVCIVSQTQIVESSVKALHLILIDVSRVLVVVLGSLGVTKEMILDCDSDVDPDDLNRIAQYITDALQSMPAKDLNAIDFELVLNLFPKYHGFCRKLLQTFKQFSSEGKSKLDSNGVSTMLQLPECSNLDYTRKVLGLLEETVLLTKIFDGVAASNQTFSVIGSEESGEPLMDESALIFKSCEYERDNHATLAVLGPMRMNYSYIVPLIDTVVEMIENNTARED